MTPTVRYVYGVTEIYPRLLCYGRGGFDVCSDFCPMGEKLKVKAIILCFMISQRPDRLFGGFVLEA